jgi:hypothetical protein
VVSVASCQDKDVTMNSSSSSSASLWSRIGHKPSIHGELRSSKRRIIDDNSLWAGDAIGNGVHHRTQLGAAQQELDKALQTIAKLQEIETKLKRQLAAQKGLVTKAAKCRDSPPRAVWECRVDSGFWTQYNDQVSGLLDKAATAQEDRVRFARDGIPYEVDLVRMIQRRCCGAFDTERNVRRRSVLLLQSSSSSSSTCPREMWHTAHSSPRHDVSCRSLMATLGASFTVSRDTQELNFALGHFARSCGGHPGGASGERTVTQVDHYTNLALKCRFEQARSALAAKGAPTDEIWVWHGTRSNSSVIAIMSDGFKVGGKDIGVPVAHGMVHGSGNAIFDVTELDH